MKPQNITPTAANLAVRCLYNTKSPEWRRDKARKLLHSLPDHTNQIEDVAMNEQEVKEMREVFGLAEAYLRNLITETVAPTADSIGKLDTAREALIAKIVQSQ